MKNANTRVRGSAAKTKRASKNPANFNEYAAGVPKNARSVLNQMRKAIESAVPPEANEIISYKIPAFKHRRVLVWYGAFSDHCSLFPTASVIAAFKDELKGYTISKGTIQFPIDKTLPVALIRKVVKARVAQNEDKTPR
jgi:uncharacterized protein YdhG (YjbR/CyaY superfamily)